MTVRLDNVSKRFGDLWAVRDLSLEIAGGELFGFLGPNGAGKTTTIKMLAGLVRPTAGRVEVAGIDVGAAPAAAKTRLGYLPDHPFVYERLTGREFALFYAALRGVPAAVAAGRLEELARLFELEGRLDELAGTYSHGMRQKLALISALLHRPTVLVIDEPMVGLDPRGARTLKALLRGFCREGGTVFLSTHTLEVAQQVCDRVGIIQVGRLRALGTIEELQRQARTSDRSLEEIFLQLTGGAEVQAAILGLREE